MLNFTDDSFLSFHGDFLVDPESLFMGRERQNIFDFPQGFSELNWIDVNLIVASSLLFPRMKCIVSIGYQTFQTVFFVVF